MPIARVEDVIELPPRRRGEVREMVLRWPGSREERDEPHCEYCYVLTTETGDRLIVRQYRNGKLHMQGNAEELHRQLRKQIVELLQERESEGGEPDTVVSLMSFPHAGSDEAGKGDYFGPLVVAAVYLRSEHEAREVAGLGAVDSKGISDRRCAEAAERLRNHLPEHCRVTRALDPYAYNRRYRDLRREGRNLNDLLAELHASCLVQLSECHADSERPLRILVDRFAAERVLLEHVAERSDMQVRQVVRGERDPSVAAASVLARAVFLERLAQLSERTGVQLPKGAGEATIRAAREVVDTAGRGALGHVAKLHFANTLKTGMF